MEAGLKKLSIDDKVPGQDVIDVAKEYDKLSPTTKESLGVLLRSISKGEALLDYDREGKQVIDYKQKKLLWDGSNANVTAVPRSDADVKVKVDACLELIDFFKTEKPPSGVLLDRPKISLTPGKDYRDGFEFVKTKRVLGTGLSAGDIMVVKDTKTGSEHAHKTMMISVFRKEEIRCWVDMTNSGFVPCLYYFSVVKNKVSIHMEILHNAKTLRSIIDEHMGNFYTCEADRNLVKPFSLFVLDGVLEAVSHLHGEGWVHKDLHGGNVMLQKKDNNSLQVKILDFGKASPISGTFGMDFRGFGSDIAEVVRLFSGLYTGMEFDNDYDVRKNWKQGLSEVADYRRMSKEEREELFCLVDAALGIVTPSEVEEYRKLVKERLSKAMVDPSVSTEIMTRVVALLFPEETRDQSQSSLPERDMADASINMNVMDGCHNGNSVPKEQHFHDLDGRANRVSNEMLEQIRNRMSIAQPDLTK